MQYADALANLYTKDSTKKTKRPDGCLMTTNTLKDIIEAVREAKGVIATRTHCTTTTDRKWKSGKGVTKSREVKKDTKLTVKLVKGGPIAEYVDKEPHMYLKNRITELE